MESFSAGHIAFYWYQLIRIAVRYASLLSGYSFTFQSSALRQNKRNLFWLAGGGNLKVEVVEGDFDDLVRRGNEGVKDAVDVGRVDLRVIRWCEDALLALISAVLITDIAAAAAADRFTSRAIHDTLTRYTRHTQPCHLHRIHTSITLMTSPATIESSSMKKTFMQITSKCQFRTHQHLSFARFNGTVYKIV